ncbi:MAG: TIGR01777 family protein [Thermodesulfobacteriota bacterium]|nr:MAG: TIGR01777 family protein [Thermodesulfobacteriota bacterium]
MKVIVLGATGFIGSHLVKDLLKNNYEVYAVIRNPKKIEILPKGTKIIIGDPLQKGEWQEVASQMDAGINLIGETIFKRWTKKYKKKLIDSRVISTKNLIEALRNKTILFNASAIGYYGDRGEEELIEESPAGKGFICELCKIWEKTAFEAEKKSIRVLIGRIGIVLGKNGGMLKVILPIFKAGLGGPLGNGKQWFSWIHIDDVTRAIRFLIENKNLSGIFNFVSPHPVRNKEFTKILSKILKRPAFIPVPVFALKLLYGELGEVIVSSTKVLPVRLLNHGFIFKYSQLENALKSII